MSDFIPCPFCGSPDSETESRVKQLQAQLDNIRTAWERRLPYKDETGLVSVTLNDACVITAECLEQKP